MNYYIFIVGFRVQIWMLKADHEHKSNWLDVPGHHAAENQCPHCDCDCSDTDKSWAAVPPLKSWRSFTTMAEWYHWCDNVVVGGVKGKPPMLWFVAWGEGGLGLSFFMLWQDTLHVCDLGITNHVVANTLVYMVESKMVCPRQGKEARLNMIWREIQGAYKEAGIKNQVGNLTMAMVNAKPDSDYPELSSHIKGAQTRSLTHAVCMVYANHAKIDVLKADYNTMDHEVWLVIKSLATFYEVIMVNMAQGNWHYSAHDCKVIEQSLHVMATMYKKLAWRYMHAEGPSWLSSVGPRWKWVPKHHHVLHIVEQARLQCMHLGWGYMSEGFMGTMKLVGESCRNALKAAHRSQSICLKWGMGNMLMLRHCMEDGSAACMLEVHGGDDEHGDAGHDDAASLFGDFAHEFM